MRASPGPSVSAHCSPTSPNGVSIAERVLVQPQTMPGCGLKVRWLGVAAAQALEFCRRRTLHQNHAGIASGALRARIFGADVPDRCRRIRLRLSHGCSLFEGPELNPGAHPDAKAS